jgi:hypothetical protein
MLIQERHVKATPAKNASMSAVVARPETVSGSISPIVMLQASLLHSLL